jgi:hypothetical protein
MDPKLQETVQKSTLLTDEKKQQILATGDKLTPEQVTQIVTAITKAETEKAQVLAVQKEKEDEINQEFYDKTREIARTAPKKAMKAAEEADHQSEEKELDGLLSELDNL